VDHTDEENRAGAKRRRSLMYQNGEFMNLSWNYDPSKREYVRGHVSHDEAIAAACAFGYEPEDFIASSHRWAHWVPDSTNNHSMRFNECASGYGAFAVTRLDKWR